MTDHPIHGKYAKKFSVDQLDDVYKSESSPF